MRLISFMAILNMTGFVFSSDEPSEKKAITEVEECPICLDNVKVPSLILPCNHKFCQNCVLQNYESNSQNSDLTEQRTSCSLCRENHDVFITTVALKEGSN